jgi:excisionase family DNA binding protein
MEPLLDVSKAAEMLGLSPWTVRLYIKQQKLFALRIGRRRLIEPQELRRFIESCKPLGVANQRNDALLAGRNS